MSKKILSFFAYYFLKLHLHYFSKIKKVIKKSQSSRNQCFILLLLDDGDLEPGLYLVLMDPDPDPGGPKTYGLDPDSQHKLQTIRSCS